MKIHAASVAYWRIVTVSSQLVPLQSLTGDPAWLRLVSASGR